MFNLKKREEMERKREKEGRGRGDEGTSRYKTHDTVTKTMRRS